MPPPRKNLERLAQAASRAGVELRIVGESGWGSVEMQSAGFVPDEELTRLHRGAAALVYLSLYECFGLPVLEAMASGTPVVTSTGRAPAELADGAAVLVNPLEVEGIAAGIKEAIARRDELKRQASSVPKASSGKRRHGQRPRSTARLRRATYAYRTFHREAGYPSTSRGSTWK